jgi:hypothetical protein
MTINAYPLQWPTGWKRTVAADRKNGRFSKAMNRADSSWKTRRDLTMSDALQRLLGQLEHMGIHRDDVVISTNVPVRLDGLPRSGAAEPTDPGAAVYWVEKGDARRVMAIDLYDRVADNIAALAATLDAMRAIERHGGATILERAFTGFTALPAPGAAPDWWQVLGVSQTASRDEITAAYRRLASEAHPDKGGSAERMAAINAAREKGLTA